MWRRIVTPSNLLTLLCTLFTLFLLLREVYHFTITKPTSTSFEHRDLSPEDFPDIMVCIKPAFNRDIALKYGYQGNLYYRGSSDGTMFVGWSGVNDTADSLIF